MHCITSRVLSGIDAGSNGLMREVLVLPARRVLPIPASIGDAEGCIISEIATAVHLCQRCGVAPGVSIAVVGTGRHGQHTIRVAAGLGAAPIVGIDPSAAARSAALKNGAQTVYKDIPDSGSFDVVIHCTADTNCVGRCCDITRQGGTLALFGTPSAEQPDVYIEQAAERIVLGERRLIGSASKGTASFRSAIELMRHPAFSLGLGQTEIVSLDMAPETLRLAANGEKPGTSLFVRM